MGQGIISIISPKNPPSRSRSTDPGHQVLPGGSPWVAQGKPSGMDVGFYGGLMGFNG